MVECSLLTAYIGNSVHAGSGVVHFLTQCVCMLRHKTADISDECVESFYFNKEDKKPFIFIRDKDKIEALKEICAEYPGLISNVELDEIIKIIKEGFLARHFFAHTMIVDNGDNTAKIYKSKRKKLKMELDTVPMGYLSDKYCGAVNATLAIMQLHARIKKFLQ